MFFFEREKKSMYSWTRSRPTRTSDQVRDKSESKYQRVQDKSETIEKRLESETGLEYYSPTLTLRFVLIEITKVVKPVH